MEQQPTEQQTTEQQTTEQQTTEQQATEIHQARDIAESFGVNAARYDRTRPRYPDALVAAIVAASPGPDVLDVGSGTGISARQFQAAGCQVLGVEPDELMAEFARQTGVVSEVARFEDWDTAGRQFDAVIAAQSWHWVDPIAGAKKAAGVLRPGGRLALFWNGAQVPTHLAEAFAAVYRQAVPDLPFNPWARPAIESYLTMAETAADGMRRAGAFGEPEQWRFDWDLRYSRDDFLDQIPTTGGHNRMPPPQLEALLAGLGAAIDTAGGSVPVQYAALVLTAARNGAV